MNYTIFFLIIIIFICSTFYFFRKRLYLYKTGKSITVIDKQTRLRLKSLEDQLRHKNNQINSYFFNFQQKNNCINQLLTIVKDIELALPVHKKDIVIELHANVKKSLTVEKNWEDFHSYFEDSQSEFYATLISKYPDLKPNDLKICSLLILNLPIKESANILSISPESLKTSRYRLRKKLNLKSKQSIVNHLISLKKENENTISQPF
jgi:DNA-binding CsgD family transcriptional regulator